MFVGSYVKIWKLLAAVVWIQVHEVLATGVLMMSFNKKVEKCRNRITEMKETWENNKWLPPQVEAVQETFGKCQNLTTDVLENPELLTGQIKSFNENVGKCRNRINEMKETWQNNTWLPPQIGDDWLNNIIKIDTADWVQILLNNGMDVNRQTIVNRTCVLQQPLNMTIISQAVICNAIRTVKLLLNRGANLELTADVGKTPLMYAAHSNNPGMVELLVTHGAKTGATSPKGYTPLHFAADSGATAIITFLRSKGADIEAKNTNGHTPLMLAANYNRYYSIKQLLKEGANIKAVDYENRTSLHLAALKGHIDSVKCLVTSGADKHIKDIKNHTAEDLAKINHHTEIVTCLSRNCDNFPNPCA